MTAETCDQVEIANYTQLQTASYVREIGNQVDLVEPYTLCLLNLSRHSV